MVTTEGEDEGEDKGTTTTRTRTGREEDEGEDEDGTKLRKTFFFDFSFSPFFRWRPIQWSSPLSSCSRCRRRTLAVAVVEEEEEEEEEEELVGSRLDRTLRNRTCPDGRNRAYTVRAAEANEDVDDG